MQDNKNKSKQFNIADKNLRHLDMISADVSSSNDLTGLIPGATTGVPDYELKAYKEMYGFGEGLEK